MSARGRDDRLLHPLHVQRADPVRGLQVRGLRRPAAPVPTRLLVLGPSRSEASLYSRYPSPDGKGGPAMATDPGTTAVVLIDFQNDFTSDGGALHGAVQGVANLWCIREQ